MGTWTPHGVFVDADVWFSRTRRDWLGMLYTEGRQPLFQVYWTKDVLAEVLANLRDQHPDWRGQRITGIRDRVAQTFEVGRIEDFLSTEVTAVAMREMLMFMAQQWRAGPNTC